MSCHPNRFRGLVFNGDWHTSLANAVHLAKAGTQSGDLMSALEALEHQLAKTDECVHTVITVQDVPPSMDGQFLMLHVKQCIDVHPATVQLISAGKIELKITARGTWEHVQSMAAAILSSGLSRAKAEMWAEVTYRSAERG
ncbi:MAG: hypothetical protein Q8S26_04655 [Azonexus sp.]|nr:hypothetical protein [Azonexus sp.]